MKTFCRRCRAISDAPRANAKAATCGGCGSKAVAIVAANTLALDGVTPTRWLGKPRSRLA